MNKESELLISLVRSQMDGTPCEIPQDADFYLLLGLSQMHKLEPFVYQALSHCRYVPEDVMARLEGFHNRAIFKDTQYDYTRQLITQKLNACGIDHVYLRGICLKHDYPEPALRTMSDTDVLVRSQDLPALSRAMKELGAEPRDGDGNHRTFAFPGDVTVEFHPNLIHCGSNVGTGVNPGWQYVPQDQPHGEMQMTEEGFYLNTMCHLANHFAGGGVGVRFVLDIWVCRHLRKQQPDRTYVERELKRIGLLKFAQLIEQLADCWFSGAPRTDLMEEMGEYIMTSGAHGATDRAVLNAMSFASGKRFSAIGRKMFYPRQDLENRFDWLRGKPWLLPVAWLVRAWQAVTKRGGWIRKWNKGIVKYSAEDIAEQNEKLRRFGVQE